MEELRLAFLLIGGVAIVGILLHGLWSVRKNQASKSSARLEARDWQEDELDDEDDVRVSIDLDDDEREPRFSSESKGDYDDLGIGAVRVVGRSQSEQSGENEQPDTDLGASFSAPEVSETSIEPKAEAPKPKIYSSVVTQPKPEYAAEQLRAMRSRLASQDELNVDDMPEPPPFLLRTDTLQDKADDSQSDAGVKAVDGIVPKAVSVTQESPVTTAKVKVEPKFELNETPAESESAATSAEKISLADQARNFVKRSKPESKPRRRKEPKIREDQMRIDFDEPQMTDESQGAASSSAVPQEVLVLNVRASEDKPIQGAALLPMLLTLGFKFGDQDIFHRHVNSNGKGPVLFSLANMFKPGVFDIDNLENFATQGVSLFMMLPIEGDPHQVFNMMHNAARKIAEEFDCQVLDGRRSALTKQSLQQYVEKIREFERQRIIAR